MLPFRRTKKLFVIALLGALVGFCGYVFLNMQVVKRLEHLGAVLDDLEREVEITSEHKILEEAIAATEEERNTLDKYFVGEDGVVGFITTVESAASAAGVSLTISSIDVESGPEGSLFESLELKLNATGTWRGLFHFVLLLEHLPEKGEIVEANLSGSGNSWNGVFSFRVLKLKTQL